MRIVSVMEIKIKHKTWCRRSYRMMLVAGCLAIASLSLPGSAIAQQGPVPPAPIPLAPPGTILSNPSASAESSFGARLIPPSPTPRPQSLNARAFPTDAALPFAPTRPTHANQCHAQLASLGAQFEALGNVPGRGRCGIDNAVRLTRVGSTELSPAATLSCDTATQFADFFRTQIMPAARSHLRSDPTAVHVAASYACRTRNHQPGARLSEHSFGRAIDVRAITLSDGSQWNVAPRQPNRRVARFQRTIREAACGPFKTVLGPGSDGFHEDHLHFDLAQRRSTYCR
ncbi:MAG: extensin family protein [Pseudomonadota bacterium]